MFNEVTEKLSRLYKGSANIWVNKILMWAALLLCTFGTQVVAQDKCYTGVVKDTNNAIISGAEVVLKNAEGLAVQKRRSDDEGSFALSCEPDGQYLLTVSKWGMADFEKRITFSKKMSATVEIVLQAKEIVESVTVYKDSEFVTSTSETATKNGAQLRDIPQSVEIVNRQLLESQAAFSQKDALNNVTAVAVAQGEGRRDQFFIRGFSALGDQFIDGVRDDAQYYRDLSNIEQIEVLKGPSAALYGRGSSGGIINRTTKKPNVYERVGSAEINAGSYGFKRASVDFGQPVIGEKFAFRVVGAYQKTGGFRQFYFQKNYSFAPSIIWKPTAATDFTFQFEYLNDERRPDRGIPSFRGRPLNVGISTYYGYPQADNIRNRVSSQALRVEHQLSPLWTVRNIFRRIGTATEFYNTHPNGVCLMTGNGNCSANIRAVISENDDRLRVLRVQYNGAARHTSYFDQAEIFGQPNTLGIRHNILFGVEIGRQNKDSLSYRNSVALPVSVTNPVLTKPINTGISTTNNSFTANIFGLYFQDQITFSRNWKALIGIRYDNFKQRVDDLLSANLDLARTDKDYSPRAGLVYQPNDWLSFYGSYSRSFQPSGENLSLAVNNFELKPELTSNYELGAKASIPSLRLNTTFSIFRLDRTNIKTADPANTARLILVGQQRTEGVEFTVSGAPTQKLDFIAGFSALDAAIIKSNTISNGVLLEGRRAQLTPKRSANLWVTYELPRGFRAGFGGYARSAVFTSPNNLVALPGYARLDAYFGWRSEKHYEVSFNLKNLANRRYYETSNGDNNIMPGSPINGSLTIRYRW